jgi:hypothetical protein
MQMKRIILLLLVVISLFFPPLKATTHADTRHKSSEVMHVNKVVQTPQADNAAKTAPEAAEPVQPSQPTTVQEALTMTGLSQSEQQYALDVFSNESSLNPAAINHIGCIGLGQNCPDKYGNYWLVASCPNWQSDLLCQVNRFTEYANGRYGGWAQANYAWYHQYDAHGNHWW